MINTSGELLNSKNVSWLGSCGPASNAGRKCPCSSIFWKANAILLFDRPPLVALVRYISSFTISQARREKVMPFRENILGLDTNST